MMPIRKPCDDAFEREERAFQKAAEKLQGAAMVCIRQAGSDLARACALFQDPDVGQLRTVLTENLRSGSAALNLNNFENVQEACRAFTANKRGRIRPGNPSPEDLIAIASMELDDACVDLLTPGAARLPSVGPATVRSRAASAELLEHR
jgi:hypothetical protein